MGEGSRAYSITCFPGAPALPANGTVTTLHTCCDDEVMPVSAPASLLRTRMHACAHTLFLLDKHPQKEKYLEEEGTVTPVCTRAAGRRVLSLGNSLQGLSSNCLQARRASVQPRLQRSVR